MKHGHLMWRANSLEKDCDAGKNWGQETPAAENEMVRWLHWINRHEFEQTPGDSEEQGSLVCCSPLGHRVEQDFLTTTVEEISRLCLKKGLCRASLYLNIERLLTNISKNSVRSDQISRSVVSDSLRPHESQHARPPCPSPTPGVHSDSRPSSQWCHPVISSSVVPFSSCPQPLPASGSFPMSQLFTWGGEPKMNKGIKWEFFMVKDDDTLTWVLWYRFREVPGIYLEEKLDKTWGRFDMAWE